KDDKWSPLMDIVRSLEAKADGTDVSIKAEASKSNVEKLESALKGLAAVTPGDHPAQPTSTELAPPSGTGLVLVGVAQLMHRALELEVHTLQSVFLLAR